jgi:hypothetical protein
MFTPDAIRNIIRIALQPLTATRHPLYSPQAEEILLMIAAHESGLGKHLVQLGGGPARGLFQVEMATMRDNYHAFINARPDLSQQIREVSGVDRPREFQGEEQLTYNPIFGAIMARLWLYRRPGQLPPAHDIPALAAYCKDHYNVTGAATPEKYITDYHRLVLAA